MELLYLFHLDPRIKQCELEVQKIIHLQNITDRLPDTFTNLKRFIKSYIPVVNAPIWIDVPVGQSIIVQMKVNHDWNVEDQSVPKIKFLKRGNE